MLHKSSMMMISKRVIISWVPFRGPSGKTKLSKLCTRIPSKLQHWSALALEQQYQHENLTMTMFLRDMHSASDDNPSATKRSPPCSELLFLTTCTPAHTPATGLFCTQRFCNERPQEMDYTHTQTKVKSQRKHWLAEQTTLLNVIGERSVPVNMKIKVSKEKVVSNWDTLPGMWSQNSLLVKTVFQALM